jgi:hypothetical protein
MITKAKPPRTERHLATAWGELDYVCKKIRYWLYARRQRGRAERYLPRLERVLPDLPDNDIAILRQEALALASELKGKLGEAIAHRKREIQLMERLHGDAASRKYSPTTRTYMLRDRDENALRERRTILEALVKAQS